MSGVRIKWVNFRENIRAFCRDKRNCPNKAGVRIKRVSVELGFHCTVEPRFNEPLHNEVLGITIDFHQPGQNYSKMYGTEPQFNEILTITNTIHKRKYKTYLNITNKIYSHLMSAHDKRLRTNSPTRIKSMCSSFKQFSLPVLEFLVP